MICARPPRRAQWGVRSTWLALLTLALTACAPSGDDPASRLTFHAPETGEYRLGYLEPPWELVSASGTSALLRIPSNLMLATGLDAGEGKYDLSVTVEPGAAEARIEQELRMAAARGEEVSAGPRVVSLAGGVVGREILTQRSDPIPRSFRIVVAPVSGGRVLRLAFGATPSLDTAEIDAMIAQVEIGSTP